MSELSARILSSISKETSTIAAATSEGDKRAPRKKRIPPYAQFPACQPPQSDGGSSGYLADTDVHANGRASTAPPGSIDLDSRQSSKRFAIPEIKPLNIKRHKPLPEEVEYNASKAFDDLVAGNVEIPKVQPHRPRIFPTRTGVNISSVNLVCSKTVKDTPILSRNTAICANPSPDIPYDFAVIAALVSDVSMLYREIEKNELSNAALYSIKETMVAAKGQANQDGGSISGSESIAGSATSSFTESASDGAENEANMIDSRAAAVLKRTQEQLSDIASIGQVMALSSRPRLLVSSSSPYQVLQVNAAFHRFSEGYSFLGKAAGDLTLDQNLMEALGNAGTERRPFKTEVSQFNWENSQPTAISVYPVGPDKGSIVTHFAIEVLGEERAAPSTSGPQDSQAAVPGHVVVTG